MQNMVGWELEKSIIITELTGAQLRLASVDFRVARMRDTEPPISKEPDLPNLELPAHLLIRDNKVYLRGPHSSTSSSHSHEPTSSLGKSTEGDFKWPPIPLRPRFTAPKPNDLDELDEGLHELIKTLKPAYPTFGIIISRTRYTQTQLLQQEKSRQ